MKITRTKVIASNHFEVPDEAGFEAWIYEKFGIKKSEVSSAKWEELGTKYFNKYRSEILKKNATYKDDKRLSPTSLRYKGYLINLDRGGDGYNVYDKYRELEDAGFASLDDAKKFVDKISVESSICASEDADENDLDQVDQEFTSKETSINSGKLPAIYKLVNFPKGSLVIDYGGGKFDNGVEYLDSIGVTGLVYDPYNRTAEHNRSVIKQIRENGGADIALCSNVLNVIKEEEARLNVLKNIRKLLKPSGTAYITVYEGTGTGEAKQSQDDAYQLHRKTADYLDEIHKVFPDAKRKGKLIIATPTGEVTASCNFNINASYDTDEVTVGIYGDEVDGFVSVDQLVSYFKSKGIKVSDVSGDMDYGWEMNLTGDPKKLFFAVCNNIPGYNSNSVDDFIDEYRIDDVEAGCDINAGYDPYDLGDEDLVLPFVKEELLEFGDSIAETFSNDILGGEYGYQLSDIYVDTDPSGKKILLHIEFDNGDITTDATVAIDKRRIKRWTDLFKYQDDILNQMKGAHDEWYLDGERPEWYHEMEEVESSADVEYDEYGKEIGSPELEEYEFVENYKGVDIKKWVSGGDPEPSEYSKTYVTAYPDGKIFGLPFKTLYEAKSAVDDYQKSGRYCFKKSSVSASVSSNDIMKVAKAAADVTSRDDLLKVLGSLLSIDKKLYAKYSEMEKGSYSPAAIGKKISDDLYYKAQSSNEVEAAVTPYKSEEFKKELQDKLYNKASKVLQTPEFGFPLNEIAEVLFVEIHEDDYNIIAEVRGELSYEGMDTLARALNPIVEKYSKNAYFDMVEPGIMEAYLPKDSIKKIQSSTVESARFQETTDYDNPIGDTVTYDVEFDFKIVVSDDGDYDIPDTEKFESIYDDDYEIKIDDEDGVSEKIFDLIEYNVPEEPGTYRVSGIAKMKYDIDGIYIHTVAPDWDEELPGTEYVTDDVDIDFDEKGSWVEDFQCQKVD